MGNSEIFIFENKIVSYLNFQKETSFMIAFTLNLNMALSITPNEITAAGRLKLAEFFI